MPEFRGTMFTIRPYRTEDAEAVARAGNNVNIWRNLAHSFPHPYRIEDAHSWIAHCHSLTDGSLHLTIDIGGTASGGVGLIPVANWSPYTFEIGYWLAESHWGRGIVTEAVGLLTRYAFDELSASRVLEKNGFDLEGRLRSAVHKDGRTGDCLVYGRVR